MSLLEINDLLVIVNLINRAQISGQEAPAVAVLLQKINGIIQSSQTRAEEQDKAKE